MYVKAPVNVANWPSGFVTTTLTVPAPAGAFASSVVLLRTVTPVAETPPNLTVAVGEKLVPVMVTVLPPPVAPVFGVAAEIVGAGLAVYVNRAVPVPACAFAFVTITSAVPV